MQGQTPGVNITSISGQPGESLKVSIRGLGTIGNAEPLYLIDGVRGDISNLNPADIESIDILKDAASAAIYGAQAANGVVLVTTKNGKEGKAVVSFDGYFGVQNVAKEVNLLNTEQYIMIKMCIRDRVLSPTVHIFLWADFLPIPQPPRPTSQ